MAPHYPRVLKKTSLENKSLNHTADYYIITHYRFSDDIPAHIESYVGLCVQPALYLVFPYIRIGLMALKQTGPGDRSDPCTSPPWLL